jgi:VanZ family protein
LLVWIFAIFLFSTDSFSSGETSRVIVPALKFLFPALSPEHLQVSHLICRKAGHILEYFVPGVPAWRATAATPALWIRPELLTVGLVLVVALSDEFHQSFVPSRTSALGDVGYDFFGGVMGLLLMLRLRNEPGTLPSHSVL